METPYIPDFDTDLKRAVAEGFAYDLWATQLWLTKLGSFKDLARAQQIFEHMLFAQRAWQRRIGYDTVQDSDMTLDTLFKLVNDVWVTILKEQELTTLVTYQNLQGITYTNSIGQMMRHVINHGTYHRGQLRGMAEAEGWDDFPETDMILWFREFGS